jgi:hypothetical protein
MKVVSKDIEETYTLQEGDIVKIIYSKNHESFYLCMQEIDSSLYRLRNLDGRHYFGSENTLEGIEVMLEKEKRSGLIKGYKIYSKDKYELLLNPKW